jgi:hypothetical protein
VRAAWGCVGGEAFEHRKAAVRLAPGGEEIGHGDERGGVGAGAGGDAIKDRAGRGGVAAAQVRLGEQDHVARLAGLCECAQLGEGGAPHALGDKQLGASAALDFREVAELHVVAEAALGVHCAPGALEQCDEARVDGAAARLGLDGAGEEPDGGLAVVEHEHGLAGEHERGGERRLAAREALQKQHGLGSAGFVAAEGQQAARLVDAPAHAILAREGAQAGDGGAHKRAVGPDDVGFEQVVLHRGAFGVIGGELAQGVDRLGRSGLDEEPGLRTAEGHAVGLVRAADGLAEHGLALVDAPGAGGFAGADVQQVGVAAGLHRRHGDEAIGAGDVVAFHRGVEVAQGAGIDRQLVVDQPDELGAGVVQPATAA